MKRVQFQSESEIYAYGDLDQGRNNDDDDDAADGDDDDERGNVGAKYAARRMRLLRKRGKFGEEEEEDEEDGDGILKSKGKRKRSEEEDDDDDDLPVSRRRVAHDDAEEDYDETTIEALEEERMEPFNMSKEREMGKFDRDMNFVWSKRSLEGGDREAAADEAWLEEEGERLKREKEKEDAVAEGATTGKTNRGTVTDYVKAIESEEMKRAPTQEDMHRECARVVRVLLPDETPVEAMRRLKSSSASGQGDDPHHHHPPTSKTEREEDLKELTSACAALTVIGWVGVYTSKREEILKHFPPTRWEYRSIPRSRNGSGTPPLIHGPFSGEEMQKWRETDGFFEEEEEDEEEVVEVRRRGEGGGEAKPATMMTLADDFDDDETAGAGGWVRAHTIKSFLC